MLIGSHRFLGSTIVAATGIVPAFLLSPSLARADTCGVKVKNGAKSDIRVNVSVAGHDVIKDMTVKKHSEKSFSVPAGKGSFDYQDDCGMDFPREITFKPGRSYLVKCAVGGAGKCGDAGVSCTILEGK